MPVKPGERLYADYPYDVPLGHGFGADRHILASCGCGREVILTERWCRNRSLGGWRTKAVGSRMRCEGCGKLGVTIVIVAGAADLGPSSRQEVAS